LNPDQLKSGDRVEDDEYGKEEGRDFALWKGYKPQDGEVKWDSPWGEGRPGWHIECSVMSTYYLSNHFDIHCGGVDNIFPHHENEIAQSCAASGEAFVNYWLHNEHLLVEGQKMSKSMGNFYTLRDLLEKGCSPEALRYTLISTHYRSKLNFTFEKVKAAQKCINKLRELKRRLKKIENGTIEIAPIAFMRGRTLEECYIILDEAQNSTKIQMKMFLTRFGKNSKMVVVGDKTQIDLVTKHDSGLLDAEIKLKNMKDIGFIYLNDKDVIRHELVRKIINSYEKVND